MKHGEVSIYIPTTALNVNGLNSPIKRCKLAKRIKKQDLIVCCL
jgi:hypothetical protein